MNQEGPQLELLLQRIAGTPQDFLLEPLIGNTGIIRVDAIIRDVLLKFGTPAGLYTDFLTTQNRTDRNRYSIASVLGWLLSDLWFIEQKIASQAVYELIQTLSEELTLHVASSDCVNEPERREELARLVLSRLGYRPKGETVEQAQDRLTTISSVERARVIDASRKAQERSRAIREALAKKAAEEAADKWGRE